MKSEMLKTDIELNSEIIMELWKACRGFGEAQMSWQKALLVPIHNKDRMDDPANHRPISLLSQVPKIVEKAMDMLIGEQYTFHDFQLGFQKGKSTETAILGSTELQRRGQNCSALLDLKSAYNTVPRRHLRERLRKTLHPIDMLNG